METIKINCLHCNQEIVTAKDTRKEICPYCKYSLEMNEGYVINCYYDEDEAEVMVEEKKIQRRNKIIIRTILLFAVLLISFLFFRHYYLLEYMYYKDAMKSSDKYECRVYVDKYPDGRYYNEVFARYDSLYYLFSTESYNDDGYCIECDNCKELLAYIDIFGEKGKNYTQAKFLLEKCKYEYASRTKDVKKIYAFFVKYPQSNYTDTLLKVKGKIFEMINFRYDSLLKNQNVNFNALSFFKRVIKYLEVSMDTSIYIVFRKNLKLNDWADYPEENRQIVSDILNESDEFADMAKPSIMDSHPPSIKKYFGPDTLEDLENKIFEKLNRNLQNIFNYGNNNILSLYKVKDTTGISNKLYITIDFTIQNQLMAEGYEGYPNVYIHYQIDRDNSMYTTSLNTNPKFLGYLLSISINWDFKFRIPEQANGYSFTNLSDPAENFNNVQDNEDAYKQMTESAFDAFADKISDNFGIYKPDTLSQSADYSKQ